MRLVIEAIHVHLHNDLSNAKLDQIISLLGVVKTQGEVMSAEMDILQLEVERNTTVDQSAVVLLNGLSDQLKAIANDPAKVLAFANNMRSSSDALAAAVAANTSAATA